MTKIVLKAALSPREQARYEASLLNAQAKTLALARILQQAAFLPERRLAKTGDFKPAPLYMTQAEKLHSDQMLRVKLKAVLDV
jgi:hypothetical protein